MKKIIIISALFLSSLLFAEEKPASTEKDSIILEKVNVSTNPLLDSYKVKQILTNDIIKGLIPYEVPFVELKYPKNNIENCSKILNDYIYKKGYINNDVKCDYNSKLSTLDIKIDLKKPIIINNITFNNDYPKIKNCMNKKFCIKKNQIASDEYFKELNNFISKELETKGYILNNVSIDRINKENNKVDIEINIKKNKLCHFGKVNIISDGNIDQTVIKNMVTIFEGNIFNYDNIRESLDILKSKKVFKTINIVPIFENVEDGVFPVNINLKEKEKTKLIRLGLGYDSYEGAKFTSSWTNFKFDNKLKKLNINLEVSSKIKDVSLNIENPLFFEKYGIDLYNKSSYKEDDSVYKKYKTFNNDVYLNKSFNIFDVSLGLRNSLVSDVNSDTLELDFDFSDNILVNSIYQNIKIEDVDNIHFPKEGYKIETELETSIMSSDFDFLELKGSLKGYHTLSKKYLTYLSGRISFDNIKSDGDIISYKKPVSGGYNKNRGYDFQSIHTDLDSNSIVLVETSLELKQNLYNDLYMFIFDDYTLLNSESYNSLGLGFYYNSPLGTFSIGSAYNEDNDIKLFFNIGVSF